MKKLKLNLVWVILTSIAMLSCNSDDEKKEKKEDVVTATDYSKEITAIANNVIIKTYKALNEKAAVLETAVKGFTIGDSDKLEAIKTAWKEARIPWESSEGFLFGPADTEGIDPAIDSWPVNVTDINAILNSGNPITSTVLDANDNARGFHTIEYFIWGVDGNKTATDLTARDVEYLKAATSDFKSKTQKLYDGWIASGDNYVDNFINAGKSGSNYTSHIVALTEFVDGIIDIADEVGTGKIEDPLNGKNGGAKPEGEESRFSHNSKVDFANNMRSIQNIYLGDYSETKGLGLTDVVVAKNKALDTEIKDEIKKAITAIESISGTFTDAIVNSRSSVENAQEAVKSLQDLLESKLKPFIKDLK